MWRVPPGDEAIGQGGDDVGAHESAVPLTDLRPRVGEEDPDLVQDRGRDPLDEDQRVAVDDTDVRQMVALDGFQQAADPRRVDVDREHVPVGPRLRQLDRRLATSEADVEHDARPPPEHRFEIEHRSDLRDGPVGEQPLVRRCSRRRHPPPAGLERSGRWTVRSGRIRRSRD